MSVVAHTFGEPLPVTDGDAFVGCELVYSQDVIAPLTLTYFYDNDFNRYTYAVWCRSERPEDFGPRFVAARNFDQLLAALDVRLEETKAGRGDVASGDFDEMGKLAETSFDVD